MRLSVLQAGSAPAQKEEDPLDGPALRRLILAGMARATLPAKPIIEHSKLTINFTVL